MPGAGSRCRLCLEAAVLGARRCNRRASPPVVAQCGSRAPPASRRRRAAVQMGTRALAVDPRAPIGHLVIDGRGPDLVLRCVGRRLGHVEASADGIADNVGGLVGLGHTQGRRRAVAFRFGARRVSRFRLAYGAPERDTMCLQGRFTALVKRLRAGHRSGYAPGGDLIDVSPSATEEPSFN